LKGSQALGPKTGLSAETGSYKEAAMKRRHRMLLFCAIVVAIAVVSAVCWHSVEEIHYLKTFYPRQFSVAEAFYASGVELVKVIIIAIPFVLVIAVALHALRRGDREP
jgi:ABC-type phosphate transport system permease subunit